MSEPKDVTSREGVGWLLGFRSGICGTPFPDTRQVGLFTAPAPNRALTPVPDLPACPPHSVVKPVGRIETSLAVEVLASPPPTAFAWRELGAQLRAWVEEFVAREGVASPTCDSVPSLEPVVRACDPLPACGDTRLYTARLLANELAPVSEEERWDRLGQLGYYTANAGSRIGALFAVVTLRRFLECDLACISCGRSLLPRWRRGDKKLSLNNTTLKTIDPSKAVNVAGVLDAFEARGWPPDVRVDLKGPQLHQALNYLNGKGSKKIRFSTVGGTVSWSLATD